MPVWLEELMTILLVVYVFKAWPWKREKTKHELYDKYKMTEADFEMLLRKPPVQGGEQQHLIDALGIMDEKGWALLNGIRAMREKKWEEVRQLIFMALLIVEDRETAE